MERKSLRSSVEERLQLILRMDEEKKNVALRGLDVWRWPEAKPLRSHCGRCLAQPKSQSFTARPSQPRSALGHIFYALQRLLRKRRKSKLSGFTSQWTMPTTSWRYLSALMICFPNCKTFSSLREKTSSQHLLYLSPLAAACRPSAGCSPASRSKCKGILSRPKDPLPCARSCRVRGLHELHSRGPRLSTRPPFGAHPPPAWHTCGSDPGAG